MKMCAAKSKVNIKTFLLALLFCLPVAAQAETQSKLDPKKIENSPSVNESLGEISPYVNVKALQDFDDYNKLGSGIDAFIPLVGNNTQLFFSNIKLAGYDNTTFDGGLYLGYRQLLSAEQKLIGIYAAFDFKKTEEGNYFEQLTVGVEYRLYQWFFGYKMFAPIGKIENSSERILPGAAAEIGYEFSKKTSLYLEGYFLNNFYTNNVSGAKLKLKQNLFSKETGSGVLDQVNLEIGVQKDKIIGNKIFVELVFKLGGSSSSSPATSSVASHMTDTISKNRIFTEKKPISEVFETTIVDDHCYYWKETGKLAKDGSSNVCPATYAKATEKNSGMTVIAQSYDSMFNALYMRIPVKTPKARF